MATLRKVIPAICLATSLAGIAAYAQAPSTTAPSTSAPGAHEWHRGHRGGGMFFVLHKLNLSADQKTRIKSIMEGQRSEFEALHSSSRANRTSLATTAPTDPGYPALVQAAQANAAKRIKLQSETWSAIYTTVLTKPQQEAIPGIVAAAQQAREARMAEWKAQHPQTATPAAE